MLDGTPAPDYCFGMQVRSKTLLATDDLKIRLTHYSSAVYQPMHAHAQSQWSFLLLGELLETVGRHENEVPESFGRLKPEGGSHAARFGRWGALMLAFDISPHLGSALRSGVMAERWAPTNLAAKQLIRNMLQAGGDGEALVEMFLDLAAEASPVAHLAGCAPRWLADLRECIREAPHRAVLGQLADAYGVDRAHLSRNFRSAFGMPPSVYRQRCMAAHALLALLDGASPSDAAAAAGFADQSHWTRALRAHAGLSPGQVRRLLDITSVQDVTRKRRIGEALRDLP